MSAGMVEPVRHTVRLERLEPLEVQKTIVVRIAGRVSLPAAVAAGSNTARGSNNAAT